MAHFSRGDIVTVPFPFSSEEQYKVRPAVILAELPYHRGTDFLLCIITTQAADDSYLMPLNPDEVEGRLTETCYIRPGYNFTADEYFIRQKVGRLKPEKLNAVVAALTAIINEA